MKKFKQYLTPKPTKLSFKEQALLDAKKKIEENAEAETQSSGTNISAITTECSLLVKP